MTASPTRSKLPKQVWTVLALIVMGVVGWFDYITGPELSFAIFYLLPICLAAWKAGFWEGALLALGSAIMWFLADFLWQVRYTHSIIPYWNAFVRLEFFVLTVMLVCNIKRLNRSLQDQTASLAQEVAERRRAQEALAESQKIFRLITENVTDLIAVVNSKGQRLYSSPSYTQLGCDAEALRGTDYFRDVLPEDRPQVEGALQQALQTGMNQRVEYRLPANANQMRYLESDWSVIKERDGESRNVVVVSRDVSLRKRMEFLYTNEKDLLEMIAEGKPLQVVLQKLIHKVESWSAGIFCSILVQDAEQNPILHEANARLPLASGGNAWVTAEPVAQTTLPGEISLPEPYATVRREWLRFRENALKLGLTIVYDHPIVSTLGEPLGFLSIYSCEPHNSEASRLQFYDKIAHVTAIALERQHSERTLRRLSSLILNAQEAERRRLARELHDSVSQMLSAVSFRLEAVAGQAPRDNQNLRQEMIKTRFLLKKTIHEVRSISENLRPSELDELGLVAAVRDLVEDFKERTQLTVKLIAPPGGERLSGDVEVTLYRIVQEALRNIEKHAEASEVLLELNWDEVSVKLTIRDNGKGLPRPNAASDRRQRMGLVDMKERCAFVGGTFSIRSEPKGGTEIAVRIPRQRPSGNTVA
jgi:PAS domain S-box-containing protein